MFRTKRRLTSLVATTCIIIPLCARANTVMLTDLTYDIAWASVSAAHNIPSDTPQVGKTQCPSLLFIHQTRTRASALAVVTL